MHWEGSKGAFVQTQRSEHAHAFRLPALTLSGPITDAHPLEAAALELRPQSVPTERVAFGQLPLYPKPTLVLFRFNACSDGALVVFMLKQDQRQPGLLQGLRKRSGHDDVVAQILGANKKLMRTL
jgi:hypothetical protein